MIFNRQWLREPLLHFLIVGVVLFLLYSLVSEPRASTERRVRISAEDITRLVNNWQRRWNRPPNAKQVESLIEDNIREEIYYREARALGLDQDDTIVRRRLAQKMEFLFKDLSAAPQADDKQLQAFLQANGEQYKTAGVFSFEHVYFNRDRRGTHARQDAERLLQRLQQHPETTNSSELGDRFMFENQFVARPDYALRRMFGKQFVDRLSTLVRGKWLGPIESGYGLHLVYLRQYSPGQLPALKNVREKVRSDWLAQKQREANEKIYASLRQRYEIIVESPTAASGARQSESAALSASGGQSGVFVAGSANKPVMAQ